MPISKEDINENNNNQILSDIHSTNSSHLTDVYRNISNNGTNLNAMYDNLEDKLGYHRIVNIISAITKK